MKSNNLCLSCLTQISIIQIMYARRGLSEVALSVLNLLNFIELRDV